MSIKHVILGYISWQPATGYDLKQIFSNTESLSWSGNSNQIYRALVELHDDGFVEVETVAQKKRPDKKLYSITATGREALRRWTLERPVAPQIQKPFLHQMMWADDLTAQELDTLLDQYLNAVGEKLFMIRVEADRMEHAPKRTARESYMWEMIYRNWIATYEMELSWIRQMRQELVENRREFAKRP